MKREVVLSSAGHSWAHQGPWDNSKCTQLPGRVRNLTENPGACLSGPVTPSRNQDASWDAELTLSGGQTGTSRRGWPLARVTVGRRGEKDMADPAGIFLNNHWSRLKNFLENSGF